MNARQRRGLCGGCISPCTCSSVGLVCQVPKLAASLCAGAAPPAEKVGRNGSRTSSRVKYVPTLRSRPKRRVTGTVGKSDRQAKQAYLCAAPMVTVFAHRYREHGWRQPRRLRSSSIHPTQGTQFRGPRDAPSRAQRMPSRRRSVGRSVSAGAKTGTTRTGWRAAGQGAWSTPALPPHVALPCPALPVGVMSSSPFHSVPRRFFAFHGDKQARGLSCFWLASWPVRPSVRRLRHRAGRNIHSPAVGACMRADSPAGKDLDLTV